MYFEVLNPCRLIVRVRYAVFVVVAATVFLFFILSSSILYFRRKMWPYTYTNVSVAERRLEFESYRENVELSLSPMQIVMRVLFVIILKATKMLM